MSVRRLLSSVLALAGLALITACSTPVTRVVLLPQADGMPSAVVVRSHDDGEKVLSQPYQRATARAGARSAPTVDQADPQQLRAENRTLFDMMPPPAQHYTVYFDVGNTVLTPASQTTMKEALAAARARSGGEIVVTGHTDTVGSMARNDELSRQRAQLVRQLIIAEVFPAGRIEAVGRGERDLAVPTPDEMDEPRNRRVTIEVR